MPDENLEAHYHFTLSDVCDLISIYGYAKVINDLDVMISEKANKILNSDGVPIVYEERN